MADQQQPPGNGPSNRRALWSWRAAIVTWLGVSVGAWFLIASLFVGLVPDGPDNIADDEDYENLGEIAPAAGTPAPCPPAAATAESDIDDEAGNLADIEPAAGPCDAGAESMQPSARDCPSEAAVPEACDGQN